MKCTICNDDGVQIFIKNGFPILKCNNCSHLFADLNVTSLEISNIYSDDYFFGGGDGYPDYFIEKNILIGHGEYYAKKLKKYIQNGKILDIGSAAGFILKGFENMGWKGVGIEPNAKMVDYCKLNFGIEIKQGTIESVQPEPVFDLVVMIQVVAHLFDLNLSLKNAYSCLKPGGYILIETWNSSSITSKLFGKNWHEYSPPSTLNFFNKKTLDSLLNRYNFQKISSGRPQKMIISNHAKSLLKHKMEDSKQLNKIARIVDIIPDNIPLFYPAEDLFWALYRKI